MFQIIGSEDILLLCIFVLITIFAGSLCKSKFVGALVGFLLGLVEIAISAVYYSEEFLSLPGVSKLVCLIVTGLVVGLFASKKSAQENMIAERERKLSQSARELNKYKDQMNNAKKDDLLNSHVLEKLRNSDPAVSKLLLLTVNQLLEYERTAEQCLDIILSLNPKFFAFIKTDGIIIAYNPTILSLYGYTDKDHLVGKNILDLIQKRDAKKASTDIKNLKFNESYNVRARNEQSIEDVATPPVSFSFDLTRNPHLILVEINTDKSQISKKADSILEISDQGIWWIGEAGTTNFITETTARLIGYSSSEITGKKISDFFAAADQYDELLTCCRNGVKTQQFEFVHKNGSRVAMQVDTHTVSGGSGNFLGLIVTLENISKQTFAEKALTHRLSMEEMIANISSRFIGISSNMVDREIVNALNLIEEFMGIRDCFLQLSLDGGNEDMQYISGEMCWHSSNAGNSAAGDAINPYYSNETMVIPLVSGGKPIGIFRCAQNTYSKEWMGQDTQLIQLIGEIFVNALAGRAFQLKLILSEERLRITLNSIGDAVIAVDENGIIQMFNMTAERLIGIDKNDVMGKALDDVFITRQVIENEDMSNEKEYTALVRADGKDCFISVKRSPITDAENRIYGEVIIFCDITEEKYAEDEIRYLSYHDRLTNLYNRTFFEEEIRRLDVKRQHPITIIMGDCNGLKITNDVFGHFEGDRLLVKTAEILVNSIRQEDIVARWGGDEFVIVLPKTDEKTANEIRDRIHRACEHTEAHPIKPSLALGSATKTDASQKIETILKEAEERMYRHKLLEGKSARNSIISSFEKMLHERNFETEEHAKRMQEMAKAFGLSLGLSDYELDNLCLLAALHDIGKIGIPDYILLKQGLLSKDEWTSMKKHPEIGYNIANATSELNNIADLILHHHERWDGTGYPEGLKGEEIPKLSRILSIIDAYDVITHARPYKEPLSKKEALDEIMHCSGTQFDPDLAKSFIRLMKNSDVLLHIT